MEPHDYVFGFKTGEAPPDAFTEEECRRLGIKPPGSHFRTREEAKRAAERYQWQLDLKRARALVKTL
jgi:hypothetical protein